MTEYNSKIASANTALSMAYTCFFIDIVGLLVGFSIFNSGTNFIHICCHVVGGILMTMFIMNVWYSRHLWSIIFYTNYPTVVIELWTLLSLFVFKRRRGRRV